jgi:hypothetical protein
MSRVLVLLGTKKGAFILESDARRQAWQLRGPFCEHWPMNHVIADPASGTIYGAGGDSWFGPAVWKSADLGASWTHSSEGLAYPEGEEPVKTVWSLAAQGGSLYAGVEPAGLFKSDDSGQSWRHIAGLRDHPSRAHWQPGSETSASCSSGRACGSIRGCSRRHFPGFRCFTRAGRRRSMTIWRRQSGSASPWREAAVRC